MIVAFQKKCKRFLEGGGGGGHNLMNDLQRPDLFVVYSEGKIKKKKNYGRSKSKLILVSWSATRPYWAPGRDEREALPPK